MTSLPNHIIRRSRCFKLISDQVSVSRGSCQSNNNCLKLTGIRHFSVTLPAFKAEPQRSKASSLTESSSSGAVQTSFAKAAKENVKTASYGAVIVVGVGVTGFILYTVFQELFSGDSPNSLFNQAAEKCVAHPKVQDLLGEPIKAFGEETRRGRRRHVSSMNYVDEDGHKGTRVQFYLQGLRKKATAQIDAREDESGHMKTRFIIVTAEDLFRTTVVVEDNR